MIQSPLLETARNFRRQAVRFAEALWAYYTILAQLFASHLPYCIVYTLMGGINRWSITLYRQWQCQPAEAIEFCLRKFNATQTLSHFQSFGSAVSSGVCIPDATNALFYPKSVSMALYWLGQCLKPTGTVDLIKAEFKKCVQSRISFTGYYVSLIVSGFTGPFPQLLFSLIYDFMLGVYYQCPHLAGHFLVNCCRYFAYTFFDAVFQILMPVDSQEWRRAIYTTLTTAFFASFFGPSIVHSCSEEGAYLENRLESAELYDMMQAGQQVMREEERRQQRDVQEEMRQ